MDNTKQEKKPKAEPRCPSCGAPLNSVTTRCRPYACANQYKDPGILGLGMMGF